MCQNRSVLFFYTLILPSIPELFTRLPCIITSQIVINQSTLYIYTRIYIMYIYTYTYIYIHTHLYMQFYVVFQICRCSVFLSLSFQFISYHTFSGIMYRTGHVIVYIVYILVLVKLQIKRRQPTARVPSVTRGTIYNGTLSELKYSNYGLIKN